MEKSFTPVLEMGIQPREPAIDELWVHHAGGILRTVPHTAERVIAEQKYVVSLLAKIESEAFFYPLPRTSAEQAQRLNSLASQGIWQAAEPHDIEPTTYLTKRPAAWRQYLGSAIVGRLAYASEAPRSWIDFLYRLEDGTAWFKTVR